MAGTALVLRRAAISARMSMLLLILFPPLPAPLTGGGYIPAIPMAVIGRRVQAKTLLARFSHQLTLLPSPNPAPAQAQ